MAPVDSARRSLAAVRSQAEPGNEREKIFWGASPSKPPGIQEYRIQKPEHGGRKPEPSRSRRRGNANTQPPNQVPAPGRKPAAEGPAAPVLVI